MAYTPDFVESLVTSTRIRLARNFASFPFPRKMDESQAANVAYLVGEGLKRFESSENYIGKFINVKITRAGAYDLFCELI